MRKTELKIKLSNLTKNIDLIKSFTDASIQAVVKANSYGISASEVVKNINDHVESYSVITLDEAIEIRKFTEKPILLLQGVHEIEDYKLVSEFRFDFVIHSMWQLEKLENFDLSQSRLWIKINTGMNRLGLDPIDFQQALNKAKEVKVAEIILMSHLASSSEVNDDMNNKQIKKFTELTKNYNYKKSLSNSGAIFNFPDAHFDIVRPGIAIYGGKYNEFGTIPVTSLRSKIISIREIKSGSKVGYDGSWIASEDCIIAYVGIGYGDGLPYFKTPLTISIGKKNFQTIGRSNMDLLMINLGQNRDIAVGDWVDIWGFNSDLKFLSDQLNTISYSLLANISSRVTKNYLE